MVTTVCGLLDDCASSVSYRNRKNPSNNPTHSICTAVRKCHVWSSTRSPSISERPWSGQSQNAAFDHADVDTRPQHDPQIPSRQPALPSKQAQDKDAVEGAYAWILAGPLLTPKGCQELLISSCGWSRELALQPSPSHL